MSKRGFIKLISAVIIVFAVIMAFILVFYEDKSSPNWMKALYFSNQNIFITMLAICILKMSKTMYSLHYFTLSEKKYVMSLTWLVFWNAVIGVIHDIIWSSCGKWYEEIDYVTIIGFVVILIIILLWHRTTG